MSLLTGHDRAEPDHVVAQTGETGSPTTDSHAVIKTATSLPEHRLYLCRVLQWPKWLVGVCHEAERERGAGNWEAMCELCRR